MNEEVLTITKANAIAAFEASDAAGKVLLETLFGKDQFRKKNVIDRIKSYEDACNELGIKPINEKELLKVVDHHIVSLLKLETITKALNEGWRNPQDLSTPAYYVWYWLYAESDRNSISNEERIVDVDMSKYLSVGGFACSNSDYAPSFTASAIGSRLCFKSRELAIYAAQQFAPLYIDYLMYENE